ncbi:Serine/threonine protein kinase [Yamadazyma tenuis]|uniref:Kinase-like protein n=1 Tax=Candida tenuis (strain ATCC 10573 / BCRC 21748 / CBS 615 / JCM 9827 / NBRC 10315 / NRRL Y-1498 / VKM Y-70) TaxID=590646 RepID=G3B8J5_CANTC|nr:kinase-like protein [Yamadazyma tenuis ATCC 10573]EGV61749.1 kinase-like protein [Yamadazyma tenuis ATCC 10573]WEJ92977.1 Serine/threonine protein kinase [Yamadazyma tenuis]
MSYMRTQKPLLQKYPQEWVKPIGWKSVFENYYLYTAMGSGSFGDVYLGKTKMNSKIFIRNDIRISTLLEPLHDHHRNRSPLVAVKILKTPITSMEEYRRSKELKFILSIPSHPNLVEVYDLFIDPSSHQVNIVMECMGQTLYHLVVARGSLKFSPVTMKSILSQVLNGIKHIHKYGFLHRDLKPENILLIATIQFYGDKENIPPHRKCDSYIVKVADYGLSRSVDDMSPYTSYVATRWYRAPEILLQRGLYGRAADMWAFGLIVMELVNFAALFPGDNEVNQLWLIVKTLGSPLLPEITYIGTSPTYLIPLGGFWREAHSLASKLKVSFPYERGVTIGELFSTDRYQGVAEVVQGCLKWDPDTRSDAKALSSMKYFKGTCTYESYRPSTHFRQNNHNLFSAGNYGSNSCKVIKPKYLYTDFYDGYEGQFMGFNSPLLPFRNRSYLSKPTTELLDEDHDENVYDPEVSVDVEIDEEYFDSDAYDSDRLEKLLSNADNENENSYHWNGPAEDMIPKLHRHHTRTKTPFHSKDQFLKVPNCG